ncbi:RNA-directed DNA polymerase, eukaryota [Tanacetum coccineum]
MHNAPTSSMHDIPDQFQQYRWTCDLSGDGEFKVKVIRNFIDDLFLPSSDVATRWVKFIPIKVNVFSWRARRDRLPTRVNLSRRGVLLDSHLCPLCNAAMEDVQHVFFRCDVARVVLRKICRWWDLDWQEFCSFSDWDAWFFSSRLKSILEGVFYVAWWRIWRLRNQLVFDASPPNRSTIFDDILPLNKSDASLFKHSSPLAKILKGVDLMLYPRLTLMAVLVEHMEGQRDLITHKSIWHLTDQQIKNIYTLYIMFTVWGCCFFGATTERYFTAISSSETSLEHVLEFHDVLLFVGSSCALWLLYLNCLDPIAATIGITCMKGLVEILKNLLEQGFAGVLAVLLYGVVSKQTTRLSGETINSALIWFLVIRRAKLTAPCKYLLFGVRTDDRNASCIIQQLLPIEDQPWRSIDCPPKWVRFGPVCLANQNCIKEMVSRLQWLKEDVVLSRNDKKGLTAEVEETVPVFMMWWRGETMDVHGYGFLGIVLEMTWSCSETPTSPSYQIGKRGVERNGRDLGNFISRILYNWLKDIPPQSLGLVTSLCPYGDKCVVKTNKIEELCLLEYGKSLASLQNMQLLAVDIWQTHRFRVNGIH